jgi:heterodisulfide reductase subunit C
MTKDMKKGDLVSSMAKKSGEVLERICFTGQPVVITESEAVLRIALGSDSLRQFIENKEETLKDDKAICKKMSTLGLLYQ